MKLKKSARDEIRAYAAKRMLHAMNAPYAVAYFFTLDEQGNLYSGMWASTGEVCDYGEWDGFAMCGSDPWHITVHLLKKGEAVRVYKGGYDRITKEKTT